jgi:hypothetical protein
MKSKGIPILEIIQNKKNYNIKNRGKSEELKN